MRRFILTGLFLWSIAVGFSQKTSKVSATYTYYAPETMSVVEAKRVALERAKIQAIADEFGTIVSQSNSTVISNRNGESDTQFFSYGGSDVKGEWIETIGEPEYTEAYSDHLLIVTVKVKGVIKNISREKVNLVVKPLRNGTELKYESTEFRDGDDLYLYFKSPMDGYLTVFLHDEATGMVYCILPYRNSEGQSYRVIADKEYIFFSCRHREYRNLDVDEYTLSCNNETIEFNTLIVLYSPDCIIKSALSVDGDQSIPKYLTYGDFNEWLGKTCMRNPNISKCEQILKITNN